MDYAKMFLIGYCSGMLALVAYHREPVAYVISVLFAIPVGFIEIFIVLVVDGLYVKPKILS